MVLLGNAMHADIPPEAPGSGLFGWLMSMLAQDVGFPSPRGGAGMLATALASRARAAGVEIRTGERVDHIELVDGRAGIVRTAGGAAIHARRAVVADTSAPMLYEELLSEHEVPPRLRHALRDFAWDLPTVKVNYRLRSTPAVDGGGRAAGPRSSTSVPTWTGSSAGRPTWRRIPCRRTRSPSSAR